MGPHRQQLRASQLFSLLFVAVACSSGSSAGGGTTTDAAEAFTKGLDFGGQATPTVGPLPEGSAGGPTVTPLPGAQPMEVTPGSTVDFQIPWQGGDISGVNIGFGGSKYFSVPVPAASGKTSGMVNVSAGLAGNVCANLPNTCHQIKCYEQVVLPDGTTVSKASAMQIVLNCTGGQGCGDTPNNCGGHTTCLQFCSCVYNNLTAFEACDQAQTACNDGCYAQNKNDPAAEALCNCNTCAPQMDSCMQKLGCPALGPDCTPQFTACSG